MPLLRSDPLQVTVVLFEVTARCNNRCVYCYNVWKCRGAAEPADLPTAEAKDLIRRVLAGRGRYRPRQITFTGGEPLLRDDLEELVAAVTGAGLATNLITNGRLLDSPRARALVSAGCRLFEIPLLARTAEDHDALAGARGAFEGAVRGIGAAKRAGAHVVAAFVATRRNIGQAEDVARLALALGADGLMFLRFNPGGVAHERAAELLPDPPQIVAALRVLREQRTRGGLPVSVSVPVPPCVVDPSEMEGLGTGFCGAGTDRTYLALSPQGEIRPCNHSPTVLGDLRRTTLRRMLRGRTYRGFCEAVPEECRKCPHRATCRAGCRAASEACFGDVARLEPLAAAHGRFPWR